MKLPFLDRRDELSRLEALVSRREGGLGVLYGRRRCGKSRLLRELRSAGPKVFYIGDDREPALQRASLASEIGRVAEGFADVVYPDWEPLLHRWWAEAPAGAVLVIDELPSVVGSSPELPSLLQKLVDHPSERVVHLLVAGSSQRMMQGLVLDSAAPLYGRAHEIIKLAPLGAGWIRKALEIDDPFEAIQAYATWGGVPRYWELAADHPDHETAVRRLVLDPLGVLHEEPGRLLLDDMRDTTQAASVLSLIGRGCHRISEIAGRLGIPATSLSRPLRRLVDMELVARQVPFGTPPRGGKRSLYTIRDPFLRFWFRFVEPERSRLGAGLLEAVERKVTEGLPHHFAGVWEDLARSSVPLLAPDEAWGTASRWWGPGLDRAPMEIDVVAEGPDSHLLVGEAKWSRPAQGAGLWRELERKIERLPLARGRTVVPRLWLAARPPDLDPTQVVTPAEVLEALR